MSAFEARHRVLLLTLVSDGLKCFQVATSAGAVRLREITDSGKARMHSEKYQAANTILGNVRTTIVGTYHEVKFTESPYQPRPAS